MALVSFKILKYVKDNVSVIDTHFTHFKLSGKKDKYNIVELISLYCQIIHN